MVFNKAIKTMSSRFIRAYEFMRVNEGGYSDHPRDKGGKTLYGISKRWHPITYMKLWKSKTNYEAELILLDFYNKKYWSKWYEEISDEDIAIKLFDFGVNIGKRRSVRRLQKALQACDKKIFADGLFGKRTLKAINELNPVVLLSAFLNEMNIYYKGLDDYDVFGKGWTRRCFRMP